MSNTNVVVPVSGGKDSQLSLQLAVEKHGVRNVVGLFCDTQFEHPKTYAHIRTMATVYGVAIHTVSAGSVVDKCLKHKRFPSGVARFCTDELKMWPSRDGYRSRAVSHGPFEVWYGMRQTESKKRAVKYSGLSGADTFAPHEMFPQKYPKELAKLGVSFRLPVVGLTSQEVIHALGGSENPLYREGFGRVGCFPCLASGARSMAKAFAHDEFGAVQARRVIRISEAIGKDPMSSSGTPCSVCLL